MKNLITTNLAFLCALVVALAACGDVAGSGGDDSGGQSGSGESGDGESGDGDGDGESGDGDGDGDGDVCMSQEDHEVAGPVMSVELGNDGDDPIFFVPPVRCTNALIAVDAEVGSFPNPGCGTCEMGECGCPKLCIEPPPVLVYPGGRVNIEWDGEAYAHYEHLAECSNDECVGSSCWARRQAESGTVEVHVAATELSDCTDSPGPYECECEPNADGWCVPNFTFGDIVPSMSASKEAVYGEGATVSFIF